MLSLVSKSKIGEHKPATAYILNDNSYSIKPIDYYFQIIEKNENVQLPIEYKKYLIKAEQLVNNHDKQSMVNLVDEVKKNVRDKKIQNKILASIAIGYNSIEYWDRNETKWKGFKFISKTNKKPWWKVGAVDFVAGGITAAAGFFSGGIAWGAVGWATARASAIAAIMIQ